MDFAECYSLFRWTGILVKADPVRRAAALKDVYTLVSLPLALNTHQKTFVFPKPICASYTFNDNSIKKINHGLVHLKLI